MKIALTFDDGPHPRYTREILDILDDYGITATFFVVGENVEYYPESFAMLLNSGHEIGNHTYSHPRFNNNQPGGIQEEIGKCHALLKDKFGYEATLFRPPEGRLNESVKTASTEWDYKIILWNVDTLDWKHTPPQQIADHVVSGVRSGDIILMHDYISYNSPTPAALRIIIPRLLAHGFQFVTVSELIACQS